METPKEAIGFANRIVLLREVTRDETGVEVDEQKLEDVLCDRYPDFVRMCEEVEADRENVISISSTLEDGIIKFDVQKKN